MWKIAHIFDGEYGCEESSEPKVLVTLMDDDGNERCISVADSWLVENNLDEGSEWPYEGEEI